MTTTQKIEEIKDRIYFNQMGSKINLDLQRKLQKELKELEETLDKQ